MAKVELAPATHEVVPVATLAPQMNNQDQYDPVMQELKDLNEIMQAPGQSPETLEAKAKDWLIQHPTATRALLLGAVGAPMLVHGVAAAEFNLTPIGEIIDAFVGILPKFLDLIIAAAPIIIGMAIVAAVVAFPEKILGQLKWK